MAIFVSRLFASEVVSCVSEGRDPTVHELFAVAERIWVEGADQRSAFGWGSLSTASSERLGALRAAQLALCGDAKS
jgi:hypothetical protein